MVDAALVGKKILYVEDDEASRYLMDMIIADIGCGLVVCPDGPQAIEKLKQEKFDLVFMDIRMPKMNGYEASRIIRQLDKDIPIVAVTAHAGEMVLGTMLECWNSGMNGFVSKPCTPEDIIGEVRRWLLIGRRPSPS